MPCLNKAEWEVVRKALILSLAYCDIPISEADKDLGKFADQCAELLEKKFYTTGGLP